MRKTTHSANETKDLAEKLAKKILKQKLGKKAIILALAGDLGSGKTTFVQGFFKGLGIKARALSPTFIILRRHKIPKRAAHFSTTHHLQPTNYSTIYHMDAYRLRSGKEAGPLGLKKLFRNSQNIFLIEWAENIKSILPKNTAWIKFFHGKKENERTIILR